MENKLKLLRKSLRIGSKGITKFLVFNHININHTRVESATVCMFCGTSENLTKEHVLPRWTFENSTERDFKTDINGFSQKYISTTIPACGICNNDLLNSLEKYIQSIFENVDLKNSGFESTQIENIIRWLEIIDYKFQVLNVIRKFVRKKGVNYIPFLADLPLSVMRANGQYSASQVIAEIRRSQSRIMVRSKSKLINSLIVFKTSNKGFHFFHHMDDFIFMELPQYKIAVFYFYRRVFLSPGEGHEAAMKIIHEAY